MFQNQNKDPQNDLVLIRRYHETGDISLIGLLFEKYMHLVYGLCLKYLKNREDSQDAVMEIFEKMTRELLKHEVQHFKSWLYILSRNHCLTILRKKNIVTEVELFTEKNYTDFVEFEALFHLKDKDEQQSEKIKRLQDCLEKLNRLQKESITLFYYNEKCYVEIAEILTITVNKVKSYLQNGKRNLKICMEINEEAA